MGHSGETNKIPPYNDYPAIEPFEGTSHEDLINKIDTFLTALMKKINAPVKECSCCNGYGVIVEGIV